MKLLFVMDPLARLQIAGDTTFAIMLAAQARGHDIWFCEPRHLSLEHADPVARAWPVTVRRVVGDHYLLGPQSTVPLKSCDAVLMRKDPPFDLDYYFATLLLERARGTTLIINDPRGLREQNEKLAVLEYPDLCPPTVVTRETTRLRAFLTEQGGEIVVKPLDASGGFGVFHVRKGDPNTGAILEQATQLGRRWTMAQKYLPEVRRGDKRILLCDGEFLCAVLRVPAPDDARGNLHVGAKPMATKLDERDTEIVRVLGPRLRAAGHFFVGLDVIGGWLTEINVTSPTGILEANTLYGDTYEVKVVERLEQKTPVNGFAFDLMRIAVVAVAAIVGWCATVAAAASDERRPSDTRPLVLLAQGDAIVASTPTAPGDPPEGAALRVRRLQIGADGRNAYLHARGVFEAQDADAAGNSFAPVAGGRLAGPLRVTEAFLSWTPHVAINIAAGALRVPFSRTRQVDDADLRMPERAAFTRTMAPDFRVGAGVGGDLGAMSYAAAVMSSSRWIDGDLFDRGAMVAVRLAAEPIGPVGLTPWRRPLDDPWTDWVRFSHAVSFFYGTLFEPRSIGAGTDAALQWRRVVATGEYMFVHAPSGNQQGATLEPGVTLGPRRLDIVARGSWQRAAGGNGWGAGAAVTLYASDPRARLQAGFERRTGPDPLGAASYALLRLTFAID